VSIAFASDCPVAFDLATRVYLLREVLLAGSDAGWCLLLSWYLLTGLGLCGLRSALFGAAAVWRILDRGFSSTAFVFFLFLAVW